jgi:hypothetical protein
LLDVFSKIYISIITKRITFYVEAFNKITETQAGFRAGYSTIDNAFVLYSVVYRYLNMKGRIVYHAFVDFLKAFDSVDRWKLFDILRDNGVKGHFYISIKAIYTSVKAC